jgi:hypothetical protein
MSKRSLELFYGNLCLISCIFFRLFIFALNSFTLSSISLSLCLHNRLNIFGALRLNGNVDLIKVFNYPRREIGWKAFSVALLLKKYVRSRDL